MHSMCVPQLPRIDRPPRLPPSFHLPCSVSVGASIRVLKLAGSDWLISLSDTAVRAAFVWSAQKAAWHGGGDGGVVDGLFFFFPLSLVPRCVASASLTICKGQIDYSYVHTLPSTGFDIQHDPPQKRGTRNKRKAHGGGEREDMNQRYSRIKAAKSFPAMSPVGDLSFRSRICTSPLPFTHHPTTPSRMYQVHISHSVIAASRAARYVYYAVYTTQVTE